MTVDAREKIVGEFSLKHISHSYCKLRSMMTTAVGKNHLTLFSHTNSHLQYKLCSDMTVAAKEKIVRELC